MITSDNSQTNASTNNECKNVKCNSDYSVQNDESLRGHCTNERRVRKRDKKVRFKKTAEDGERGGAAVTCNGRLFHRRAAATGNALLPTVNRSIC